MYVDEIRQRTWDFGLTIVTVALLASLGLQSFAGTLYVWWAQTALPGWEQVGYGQFVERMNLFAAPQLVLLVVVMGLCVPKRLFRRSALLWVSLLMLFSGFIAFALTRSVTAGLTVYLALAALIQVAVVALTASGARGPSYLTEGRLTKLGSGLLHLGFIAFAIVVAALQQSSLLMPAFWLSTALMMGGTLLSFYAHKLAWRPRAEAVEREREME